MNLDEDMHVDAQSIGVVKDKESCKYVDYFFEAALWGKDPRSQKRFMKLGECRGLFRFDKETLDAELLLPMTGDDAGSRFFKAAGKVLKEFRSLGCWPDRTHFASG